MGESETHLGPKRQLNVNHKGRLLLTAANDGLKRMLETSASLTVYYSKVPTQYPELSYIVLKILLLFPSTYFCETGFSTWSAIKTKHRNILDILSLC